MRPRSTRLPAISVSLVLAASLAACGSDREDTATGSTAPIPASIVATTAPSQNTGDDDESNDNGGEDDGREYPTLDEVGRAEFTHTIVAGDFLRRIADTYGVEIDDIVGANEWEDGRDHLLLPGDEIYLPADATRPTSTTVSAASGDDGDTEGGANGPSAGGEDLDNVCAAGQMADVYERGDGETIDEVASSFGITPSELQLANAGQSFDSLDVVWIPCQANWPRFVRFDALLDGPVCTDESMQGTYTVQAGSAGGGGQSADEIATALGISVDQLTAENPTPAFPDLQAGDEISVCSSWFE